MKRPKFLTRVKAVFVIAVLIEVVVLGYVVNIVLSREKEKNGIIIKKEIERGITIDMLAAAAPCVSR